MPASRFWPAASRIRPACSSLKMLYHSGPESLSIASVAALLSFGAGIRPGRQQGGGEVGDRAAHRLGELRARGLILLLLDRAHAEHEPRDAVVLVGLEHALGELGRLVDIAIGEHGEEGAVEQVGVAGIAAQRGAVIGRGRGGIALDSGMPGRQIVPGHGGARIGRRRLRPCGRKRRRRHGEDGKGGQSRLPEQGRENHGSVNSIWRKRLGAAAFGGREWPVCVLAARTGPPGPVPAPLKTSIWQHRDATGHIIG